MKEKEKKMIKIIKLDTAKCTGCRSCEVICSAFHAEPKYSIVNPGRSRIWAFSDEPNDLFLPILAGPYTDAECLGRHTVIFKGKEYGECSFCRASCPARGLFKEPGTDIPLKCDMCGEPPPPKPLCVKWCKSEALTYHEREEENES